jgi:ribosomal protein S18 acetylase RimI-like enzyme
MLNLGIKVVNITEYEISEYAKILEKELHFSEEEALDYVKKKENVLRAVINNQSVGFLSYFNKKDGSYYIDDFDIIKEYRRRGIGTLMLQELVLIVKTKNTHKISLHVAEKNIGAINFFLKNKFSQSKLIHNFYGQGFHSYSFSRIIHESII